MAADDRRNEIRLEDFPFRTSDKLRYGDTDRQGHVNNAVFATFLETGRVELLYSAAGGLAEPGSAFVVARVVIDFKAEVNWPGEVRIGSRVAKIGRSSVVIEQGVFQDGHCVATGETVAVLMDETTRRSKPLPPALIEKLTALLPGAT